MTSTANKLTKHTTHRRRSAGSNTRPATVFVAMSGGVDSSVAALLLKHRGYDAVGVYMRSYNLDGCSEADAEDARRAAEEVGIPFYVWDFEEEYKERVVGYMLKEYRAGRTPNPDVMCNREIKFGLFLKKALAMGADFVATGHYARIARGARRGGSAPRTNTPRPNSPSAVRLFAARDTNKDQSYFLWTLTQHELARCLFPIGGYEKREVRAIARRAGLHTAEKKDSQGICFLGKVSLKNFLAGRIPVERGPVYALSGAKIGEHGGAALYTIGERHGLNLGEHGSTGGARATKPLYVAEKDMERNALVVVEGGNHPALCRKSLELTDINWISPVPPAREQAILARVRYRQPLAEARLILRSLGVREPQKNNRATLTFRSPQKFVAPGQSAVFYSIRGELLGGGIIEEAE